MSVALSICYQLERGTENVSPPSRRTGSARQRSRSNNAEPRASGDELTADMWPGPGGSLIAPSMGRTYRRIHLTLSKPTSAPAGRSSAASGVRTLIQARPLHQSHLVRRRNLVAAATPTKPQTVSASEAGSGTGLTSDITRVYWPALWNCVSA